MKKLWGIIIIGLSMSSGVYAIDPIDEWNNIIEEIKKLGTDKEIQQATHEAMVAFQKILSLSAKKITHQVSPSEKEKIVVVVDLLNRIIAACEEAVRTGRPLDSETAAEAQEHWQELEFVIMPLVFLLRDPAFLERQLQLSHKIRMQTYNGIKRTMAQLGEDLRA